MSAPLLSFPRKRESSVSSLQRRWVPAFAGTTNAATSLGEVTP